MKGNSALRLRNPDITKVRLVISKLVNDIVVLAPAKITEIIKISWLPTPVYFILDDSGVINVHPAVVNTLFEHFVTYTLRRLALDTRSAVYQKESECFEKNSEIRYLTGT